jgi:3-methyl-2-oxobutanoate hydroxymethyltransferase
MVVARPKVTVQTLFDLRASNTPITMLTAYDYPTARRISSCHLIDMTLVGDSLAQVCLGLPSTTSLTLSQMVHHAEAVRRGTTHPFLVADMPFGTYTSPTRSLLAAMRLVRAAGVDAVKLEGGTPPVLAAVRALSDAGILAMGHLGLLPQRLSALGGYRVQARTAGAAHEMLRAARALQDAGAFALVLEAVPARVAAHITARLDVPTIGIGAGVGTSGQVLVWDDVVASWHGHKAKFVRHFADVGVEASKGVDAYAQAVRNRSFPAPAESYDMDEAEWAAFLKMEHDGAL